MSEQYPGGWITKSPPTPSGPYFSSTAPGIWNISQQAFYKAQNLWPTQGLNPPVYWVALISPPSDYTSTGTKYKQACVFDTSGNIYTQMIASPQAGPNYAGACIMKITPNGVISWAYLNSKSGDSPAASGLAIDSSANIYYAGYTDGNNAYTLNQKWDSSGNLQWAYSGTASNYYAQYIDTYDNSNFYAAGTGYPGGYWQKTNASGTVLAASQITDSVRTYFWIQQIYASSTGDSYAAVYTIYEGGFAKFNSSGTIQVYTKLGDTGYNGNINGFVLDNKASPSYFYAAGFSQAIGPSANLYKVSASNGTSVAWSKLINSVSPYYGWLDTDASGNIYYFNQDGSDNKKVVIIKFDSSGNVLWQRTLSYSLYNIAPYAISVDKTNSVFVLLLSVSSSPIGSIGVVRLPIDGSQTGTYGNWTYASSSYTVSGGSGSWVSGSYSQSSYTPSLSAYGGTNASKTFTNNKQDIA